MQQTRDANGRDIRDIIAENRENIYRIGHSNKWACRACTVKADRQFLEIHVCTRSKLRGNKGDIEKTNAELLKKYDAARARINKKGA